MPVVSTKAKGAHALCTKKGCDWGVTYTAHVRAWVYAGMLFETLGHFMEGKTEEGMIRNPNKLHSTSPLYSKTNGR